METPLPSSLCSAIQHSQTVSGFTDILTNYHKKLLYLVGLKISFTKE